jgi:cyclohexanecarboxylate-CoA ligase
VDADGFLSVTGRLKDIIIRGGENISAKEVEDLLITLPGLTDVAVVAMPDPVLGERVCAFVESDGDLRLEDIVQFLREHAVASYKLPERLEQRLALPRNSAGKLRKDLMRAEVAALIEAGRAS